MIQLKSAEMLQTVAAALREQLEAVDYTHQRLQELLGSDDLEGPREALHRHRLQGSSEPLAIMARLFLLADRVAAAEVAGAVAGEALQLLRDAGILEALPDGDLRSALRIVPFLGLYICSDRARAEAGATTDDPQGPMPGPAMATGILARAIPEAAGRRVLDLGCGVGPLGLHAARSSEAVVGLDLSIRGLRLARLNATLNGIDNLELVCGDMTRLPFGPRFDLVICNPPFVATLNEDIMWTSGGPLGERLLAPVLRQLSHLLVPGGEARILCNLALRAGEGVADRLREIVGEGRLEGLDAVAVESTPRDPEDYALQHCLTLKGGRIQADVAEAGRLLGHFEAAGIERLVLTLLAFRRVDGQAGRLHCHGARPLQVGSGYFESIFDLWQRLREGGSAALLETRPGLIEGLTIRLPFPPAERAAGEIHSPPAHPWKPQLLGNDLLALATLFDGQRTGRAICRLLEQDGLRPELARRLVVKGTELLVLKGLAVLTP